jgi:hypothetical protein
MRTVNNKHGYAALIREAAARVAWAVDGFGRVPDDFESWIGPIIGASAPPEH